MREPTENFASLVEIFNFKSKRELDSHSKSLIIYQQDLVCLIFAAQHGALLPYKYANHFAETVPETLHPSDAEQKAITSNGTGAFKTREARKFAAKIFQTFKERRSLAAHLFYTQDYSYWHLFYFDNRDKLKSNNHWKHGPHIHYVSHLWPSLSMEGA